MALEHPDNLEASPYFQRLDERVTHLSERLSKLEASAPMMPLRISIGSFAPEPYSLRRPMEVVIEQVEDGFVATFFDANISASGDNQQEAFDNLKSLILDIYDSLCAEPPQRLGPEPRKQLAVLESFLEKI